MAESRYLPAQARSPIGNSFTFLEPLAWWTGCPTTMSAAKQFVTYEGWRAKRFPLRVAIVDDFDRRQVALDAARHRIPGEGRRARGNEILSNAHGDVALTPTRGIVACIQYDAAVVRRTGMHATSARVRDRKVLLHDVAGAADLVADQRTDAGD
jgi:hypothetical protein